MNKVCYACKPQILKSRADLERREHGDTNWYEGHRSRSSDPWYLSTRHGEHVGPTPVRPDRRWCSWRLQLEQHSIPSVTLFFM